MEFGVDGARLLLTLRPSSRCDSNRDRVIAVDVNLAFWSQRIATVLTTDNGPCCLNPGTIQPIGDLISRISRPRASDAYDTQECHALLKKKGARATIPPRKNAALWEEGHPHNEAVKALKAGELKQWKQACGYHQRSKAETAMYRSKQLIGSKLSLRNYNAQVGEALAGVKAMNKMIGLGMPVRQRVK